MGATDCLRRLGAIPCWRFQTRPRFLHYAPLPLHDNLTATSKASPVPAADATPASTRVKRRPKAGARSPAVDEIPTSPPPSYADVASGAAELSEAERPKYAAIDAILGEEDLYKILGVRKTAKNEEIRRGFLNRSRTCHPE